MWVEVGWVELKNERKKGKGGDGAEGDYYQGQWQLEGE